MSDTQDEFKELNKRVIEVEGTLKSHLAACEVSTKSAEKSMETLTGEVVKLGTSVNGLEGEVKKLDIEKAKTEGMVKGVRLLAIFLVSLVGVASVIMNMFHFLGDK